MATRAPATIDDLYRVKSKAELVGGEIVHMSPTGALPGRAAGARRLPILPRFIAGATLRKQSRHFRDRSSTWMTCSIESPH
jgi:hypothetical protein